MQKLERTGQIPNNLTCFSLCEVDVFLDASQKGATIHFFKHQIKPETKETAAIIISIHFYCFIRFFHFTQLFTKRKKNLSNLLISTIFLKSTAEDKLFLRERGNMQVKN